MGAPAVRRAVSTRRVRKAGISCAVNPQARGLGLHFTFVEQVSQIRIAAIRLKASVCKLIEGRHVLPLLRAIPPETHNPRNFTERRVLCRCARSYRKGKRSHNNDGSEDRVRIERRRECVSPRRRYLSKIRGPRSRFNTISDSAARAAETDVPPERADLRGTSDQ